MPFYFRLNMNFFKKILDFGQKIIGQKKLNTTTAQSMAEQKPAGF